MSDWSAKQGDTALICADELSYTDGTSPDLTSASVKFVMRARSANAPTTNLAATITHSTSPATVSYQLSATDTATAGLYAQTWQVTFSNGSIETFPTVGYNTIEIQENLTTVNQTLVEIDDLKDYLGFPANDRTHDGELLRFLAGVTPVITNITGPILPTRYVNERYDGGAPFFSLRHRPIIDVENVTEYRGNIAYNLTQVPSHDLGTIYSYMFDPSGRIIRTTVGGGTTPFPAGTDQVSVTYSAGHVKTPENVRMATLELVRLNYQQTQQAGGGRIGGTGSMIDEDLSGQQMLGFFVPGRVRELLAPHRKHPKTA